jgi:hypothetical protein
MVGMAKGGMVGRGWRGGRKEERNEKEGGGREE